LDIFQITHVIHLLRPYAEGGRRELLAQPKLYGFDTGFVCHAHGWDHVRPEEAGLLWEHLVLDTLLSLPLAKIHFWRDKQQREVDFVLPRSRGTVDAIECKWNPDSFSPDHLHEFRRIYPAGRNIVASPNIGRAYRRRLGGIDVLFASPANWAL